MSHQPDPAGSSGLRALDWSGGQWQAEPVPPGGPRLQPRGLPDHSDRRLWNPRTSGKYSDGHPVPLLPQDISAPVIHGEGGKLFRGFSWQFLLHGQISNSKLLPTFIGI